MIICTSQQEVSSVDIEHIAALDRQTVVESVSEILATGADQGYVEHYRFGIFHHEEGTTIIGLDCFLQVQSAYNMLRMTILASAACALIVFILLLIFSEKAIRPFVENLERQRQFVTDASHELKTPLAILSADIGLLESSPGERKWLSSAQAQISRLDNLIKNLVELARTEETVQDASRTVFSLSDIALACGDSFQPLAEAAGKSLRTAIAPNLHMRGIQDNLFRLFSILLDNAVKYCDPGGEIDFTITRRGRLASIIVSNPCAGLDPSQLPRYFDRFYRADSSRTRATGGYGIGLSTARAIVTRHHGHIANRYAGGIITFSVTLPLYARKKEEFVPNT